MTFEQAYTSLKQLYKSMMFPTNPNAPKYSLTEIDSFDSHFFTELMNLDEPVQEEEVYLSDIW